MRRIAAILTFISIALTLLALVLFVINPRNVDVGLILMAALIMLWVAKLLPKGESK